MFRVYCIDKNCAPKKAHYDDAGFDIKSIGEFLIKTGEVVQVPCGFHMELPLGWVGLLYPRSGISTKHGIVLANTVGVIDSGYRGQIICAIKNIGPEDYKIEKYDRIAQLVISQVCTLNYLPEVKNLKDLTESFRGEGGFGHTGD